MASRTIGLTAPARVRFPRAQVAGGLAAVLVGLAAAIQPYAAVGIALVFLVVVLALLDLTAMERLGTIVLVGGAVLLGYGWANLGIRTGGIPLPATEILFLPLAAIALLNPKTRLHGSVLVPLVLYALLVFVRLVFDYPNWGIFAVRDTTAAIEAFVLVVGYRAVARDGPAHWARIWGFLSLAVILRGLLSPFQARIEALSPIVGLQRPAPLFDERGVKFSVIAAGLFFLVFTTGWKRMLALGVVAGMVGIFQARSLYVLFPLSLLVVGWATRQLGRVSLRMVPIVVVGALLITFAGNIDLPGRRGEVSFDFIGRHAATLLGEQGPHAGAIRGRMEWFRRTVDYVTRSPGYVAAGVGLGPDLTFGMLEGSQGQAVRKPHDDYLEVFARTGLIGFVLFMWMLLACVVPIAKRARSGAGFEERFCAWILAASVVYLGVAGAQPLLSFPYGSVPLFFLLGMGVAASRLPRRPAALAAPRVRAASG